MKINLRWKIWRNIWKYIVKIENQSSTVFQGHHISFSREDVYFSIASCYECYSCIRAFTYVRMSESWPLKTTLNIKKGMKFQDKAKVLRTLEITVADTLSRMSNHELKYLLCFWHNSLLRCIMFYGMIEKTGHHMCMSQIGYDYT